MNRRGRLLALLALVLGALLCAAVAAARVEGDSEYTKAQTYSGALRYLRVDLGYEVVEKDPDAAYLVFRYQAPGQAKDDTLGTIEVVEAGERTRIFVRIPRMPEYHETILRDGLLRKLRDEYGPPEPRKPDPPAKKPSGDAGVDDDAGSD
ncbi:MAG TPA: hypothetical protein VMI54_16170 [Polyangiaceae bacterium]|nr:hypothetical protein [Polyangiaceae bacterium]